MTAVNIIFHDTLLLYTFVNAEIYFLSIWRLLKSSLVMSVKIPMSGNRDSSERILTTIVTVVR